MRKKNESFLVVFVKERGKKSNSQLQDLDEPPSKHGVDRDFGSRAPPPPGERARLPSSSASAAAAVARADAALRVSLGAEERLLPLRRADARAELGPAEGRAGEEGELVVCGVFMLILF